MRADRLVSLILLLQTRGKTTARTLAAELEVSTRTVLRDVDALSAAGVPVISEGGHGGGISLDEGYRTSLTGLKDAEARSLFLSNNTQILHDIGLGDAAESMLLKLTAALPAVHQPSVEQIRQRIYIDPLWWWHDSTPLAFWDDLQRAVYEDRRIRIVYENHSHDVSEREIEPYSLVAKSSTWYLIARRDSEFRTYRVSRLRNVTVLAERFHRDAAFDLPSYWQAHLGEFAAALSGYQFTLRVDPSRLPFMRWLAPGRCEVIDAAQDARGWAEVAVNVENEELAKMLVFGLGTQAEVIEPAALRAAVLSAARAITELARSR
ncbi:MAG: YafY family transcriptional regulator [Chloroflexi bacterium]|nr:YafY family transcriptional regulator [Chloroflexota bacterium]